MTTTYAAHIITSDSETLGDPGITITTTADPETGGGEFVADYPLGEDSDPAAVLANKGWRVLADGEPVEPGYVIATVEPADVLAIVEHVAMAAAMAGAELERQSGALQIAVRDAMNDGGSATELARAAGKSRERIYQLRDGRR